MPDLLDLEGLQKAPSYNGMAASSRERISPVNLDQVLDGGQFLRPGAVSMLGKVTEDTLADGAVVISKAGFTQIQLIASPDADVETSTVDGFVANNTFAGTTWAGIRNQFGVNQADDTFTDFEVYVSGDNLAGMWDQLKRGIATFDLSSMPVGADVISATLTVISNTTFGSSFGASIVMCEVASLASETGLVVGDWSNFGSVDFSNRISTSTGWTVGATQIFTLNDAGVAFIQSAAGGIARFGFMVSYDIDDIEPTWANASDGVRIVSADHATLAAPTLDIVYWG